MISLKRIVAVARKEHLHILHDPRSLMIIFLLPAIQLVMFGYALNMEIQEVKLAVYDQDGSTLSMKLLDEFRGSSFFKLYPQPDNPDRLNDLFLDGKVKAGLIIRPGFGQGTRADAGLQLVIDASDPNAATLVRNYVESVVQDFGQTRGGTQSPLDIRVSLLYNPGLVSSYFFVPGLIALILIMISALLTSITVTRERETGTLEQLLVSPLTPLEFILGKLSPYVTLALVIGGIILGLGIVLFHVAFVGSALLLALMTLIYVLTALSLGLMISTVASSQLTAMMGALIITLLPSMMISGFIFPISSMPKALQWISCLVPARYYLRIVRGIMLKGNSFADLLPQIAVLTGFFLILLIVAWRRFNQRTR
jgi:ABC-2 type transport system permease protein